MLNFRKLLSNCILEASRKAKNQRLYSMSKGKPRLVRLTAILTQLQSKRILTAREIAEKHDVSIRTVYRDIRTLEQSGIPIYTQEGKGYSIQEGYSLPPIMFSEQEANALITAQQIIGRNKDKSLTDQYTSAIEKIKAVMKFSQKDKTQLLSERIQIGAYKGLDKTSDYLMQIQTTIINYQLIIIVYLSLADQRTKRKIEPFALLHSKGNWVLIAFCRLRKEFRAFRLDCIQSLIETSQTFEPHKITLQEYFDQNRKNWVSPDIPMTQCPDTFVSNKK